MHRRPVLRGARRQLLSRIRMTSKARTVSEYLAGLPAERRAAIKAVREVILRNLDPGFEEGIQYGMIGYYVPHHLYPAGYHCDPRQPLPFVGLGSQKHHMAVYLMCLYSRPDQGQWFREAWARTGKKLDLGKCCLRFKKLEDLALEVLGEAIRRIPMRTFIEHYEAAIQRTRASKRSGKPRRSPKALG